MTHRFAAMGCEVVVGGAEPDVDAVAAIFERDERTFTRFADDSELVRVNRADGPVLVSARFARALAAALWASRVTGGLVDPTLLDALEGAGYNRDFAELEPTPDPPRAGPCGRAGEVGLRGRLLTLPPRTRLDLNAVVKSMAVDEALAAIGDGWVSAGGDLATSGPLEVALPHGGSVRLERGALATSGSNGRRWMRAGRWQHHLIDPRTGRPAESPWEQVTACGESCLVADTAAKAAFLLGDAGPDWLDARGMAGRFAAVDGSIVLNASWRSAVGQESLCI
jgi:thiamine biosynthesis lipoprotein